MTKIEIQKRIEALEKEIAKKQNHAINLPFIARLKRILMKIENHYDRKIEPDIKMMRSEILTLKIEYNKPVRPRLVPPDEIKAWFDKWGRGIDFGYEKPYIRWISEDKKWVIITNPGGTAGTGTPMGTGGYYYAPTRHALCRISEEVTAMRNISATYEGKLTNAKIEEFKELIKMLP